MDVGYEDILKAVLDEPDNVGLRLILADWQEEYGGENGALHAELIRLQCESDKHNPRVSELIDLLKRTNLLGHIASRDEFHTFRVERGFIEVVNCTAEEWYDEGDKCVARSPIREVRLSNRPDLGQDKWWRLSQRRQQNYEMARERVKYEHRQEQDIDRNWTVFVLLRTCWPSVDRWEMPTEEQEQFRRNQERARSQGIPYRFIVESLGALQSGAAFVNPPMQEFQMASGVLHPGTIIRDGNGSPIGMVEAGGAIGSLNVDGNSPVQGLERATPLLQDVTPHIGEQFVRDGVFQRITESAQRVLEARPIVTTMRVPNELLHYHPVMRYTPTESGDIQEVPIILSSEMDELRPPLATAQEGTPEYRVMPMPPAGRERGLPRDFGFIREMGNDNPVGTVPNGDVTVNI